MFGMTRRDFVALLGGAAYAPGNTCLRSFANASAQTLLGINFPSLIFPAHGLQNLFV